MYKPERQAAIKRKHWQDALAGAPQPRKTTRKDNELAEFERMRHVVTTACELNGWGAGTAGFALACSLAGCLGVWPRVRRAKKGEVRMRYRELMKKLERGESP